MKFAFFIFPLLNPFRVHDALALNYFHFKLLLNANCIQTQLRQIDFRLNHRIQEAGKDFKGLLMVKYSILALLNFDLLQPCTNLQAALVVSLQSKYHHVEFSYSF
jgi:hypothetical protein